MKEDKGGEHEGGKKHKKHLHEIRSVQAEDGSIVHHHTYKAKKEDDHAEPERQNVATSTTPEDAGQHVAEQMGMNEQPDQGGGEAQPDPNAAAQPDPDAGATGQ